LYCGASFACPADAAGECIRRCEGDKMCEVNSDDCKNGRVAGSDVAVCLFYFGHLLFTGGKINFNFITLAHL